MEASVSVVGPPDPRPADCSDMMDETMLRVVFSSVSSASVGAFAAARVPELGGLIYPLMMASQIWAEGMSGSVQRSVKRGESHRTIDDGSSNRWKRLSRLQSRMKRYQLPPISA